MEVVAKFEGVVEDIVEEVCKKMEVAVEIANDEVCLAGGVPL